MMKQKGGRMPIRDVLEIVVFIGVWILLQRVILPKMGVST
jgi:hypothetical protein